VISDQPSQHKTKAVSEKKQEKYEPMFTGTLIEDLIATVERAEARTQTPEPIEIEPWIASTQDSTEYDSKLLVVA
jgi:hypothetical protein